MTDGPDVPGVPPGWPVDPALSPRHGWLDRIVGRRLKRRVTVISTTQRAVPFDSAPYSVGEWQTGSRFDAPGAGWYQLPPPPGPTYEELVAQFKALDLTPTGPREIAVSDRATLDALLAGVPQAGASPLSGPIGSLTGIPIIIDDTLPPGQLHVREHDGRVSAAWELVVGGRWLSLPVVGWPEPRPFDEAPPNATERG